MLLLLCRGCQETMAANDAACTNNGARNWWHANSYSINLRLDTIQWQMAVEAALEVGAVTTANDSLQLDLAPQWQVTGITIDDAERNFSYDSLTKAYFLKGFRGAPPGSIFRIKISYHGWPQTTLKAPWGSGLVLKRSAMGLPWLGLACQADGASIWLPCKNWQGDEPDSVSMAITVPAGLTAIANGRLLRQTSDSNGRFSTFYWHTASAINLYDITFYIGDYLHWHDVYSGQSDTLSLDYYALRENESKARKQFEEVKPMLRCFEGKVGRYPFYKDGYKLVEAPYLGMEHQSAIAYGNEYNMGYRGKDRSKTGIGLKFDFIIIHESAHEWYGNSITAYDKADTWIHEGFTSYLETIYAECLLGKVAAYQYQWGKRDLIENDKPVRGSYNACDEGSGDHYDKGAFMVHMIREMMHDDKKFYAMLQEMNRVFFHKIVRGADMEHFMEQYSGLELSSFFKQYLDGKTWPTLEVNTHEGKAIAYRWVDCVPGFNMPAVVLINGKETRLPATTQWQSQHLGQNKWKIYPSPDFLFNLKQD
ncbi:MAG: M1 family metallopeptidase [Edaphocola sp.]